MDTRNKITVLLFTVISAICIYKFVFKSGKNSSKVFIENLGSDVRSLNPHVFEDGTSFRVSFDIYEGLIKYDQSGNLVNAACENYTISEDKKTYTFKIRENAKWSNGDSLTADDFVYSLRRAITPATSASGYVSYLFDIKNAKAIAEGSLNSEELSVFADDKHTLRIELENPNAEFIHYITLPVYLPIHRPTIEKYGLSAFSKPDAIVGNGPYKITSWIHNDHMILVKDENYWDKDNVSIEKIKFLMILDGSVDLNTFRTKNEHMTYYNIPIREKSEYVKEFGNKFVNYNILCQYKLDINFNNEKFTDVRVRKALNIALNREKVCSVVKTAVPSYSVVHEDTYNGEFKNDLKDIEDYSWMDMSIEERNKLARELLMECGYTKENPLKIEILSKSDEFHKSICNSIQDIYMNAFQGLVKCTLLFNDPQTFYAMFNKGQFELVLSRWIADYNLPSNFSFLYITNSNMNKTKYSNNEVDTLFYDSLKCDIDEYIEKQHDLIKIAAQDYPIVPIALFSRNKLCSDELIGLQYEKNVLDRYSTKDIKFKKNN